MKNAPDKTTIESALGKPHFTPNPRQEKDPLIGWYSLASRALQRQQKRNHKRQRGMAIPELLGTAAQLLGLVILLICGFDLILRWPV